MLFIPCQQIGCFWISQNEILYDSSRVQLIREDAMGEMIRKVDYFTMQVPAKPGEATRVLDALREAGVNLLAFTGFPEGRRRAQLDFVAEETAALKAAAKRAKMKLSPKKSAFLVQGEDRPGAVAEIIGRLAAAKINVTAIEALCAGDGRFGAIFWVKGPDLRKAAKVLGVSASI
jgi:hypothetical protein